MIRKKGLKRRSGQGFVEYDLTLALVTVVLIGVMITVGNKTKALFNSVSDKMNVANQVVNNIEIQSSAGPWGENSSAAPPQSPPPPPSPTCINGICR